MRRLSRAAVADRRGYLSHEVDSLLLDLQRDGRHAA